MFTIAQDQQKSTKPRVVIIGGGFGGLSLAKKLKNAPVDVLLLDKHNYHTFSAIVIPGCHWRHSCRFYCVSYPKDIYQIQKL